MASKYFRTNKNKFVKTGMLLNQKKMIEQHYKFIECSIDNNVLVCKGVISSPDYKFTYKVEIKCEYGTEPRTIILEPTDITPSNAIHMYSDHSLCLYYPLDMKWTARTAIFKYTIPWLIEWIIYFELYLVNGNKWEGSESPVHFTEEDINVNEDNDSVNKS